MFAGNRPFKKFIVQKHQNPVVFMVGINRSSRKKVNVVHVLFSVNYDKLLKQQICYKDYTWLSVYCVTTKQANFILSAVRLPF